MKHHDLSGIVQAIELETADDEIGLWAVVRMVERESSGASEIEIKLAVAKICRDLLLRGATIGQYAETGEFLNWGAESAVDRLLVEWGELGRTPDIGEIAWLRRGSAA